MKRNDLKIGIIVFIVMLTILSTSVHSNGITLKKLINKKEINYIESINLKPEIKIGSITVKGPDNILVDCNCIDDIENYVINRETYVESTC